MDIKDLPITEIGLSTRCVNALRRVGVDRFHLLEVLDDLLLLGLLFGSHLLAGGEAEAAGLAGSVAVLRDLSQIVSEEAPEDERDKQ